MIAYLTENPDERSTDVKEHFNNRFSYVEINVARKVVSQQQLSESDH